jgi:hypothetical protein
MSEYTTYDFEECMCDGIIHVHAAWGIQGAFAEWEGGFLVEKKDGTFAYLTGWCDTTGWG